MEEEEVPEESPSKGRPEKGGSLPQEGGGDAKAPKTKKKRSVNEQKRQEESGKSSAPVKKAKKLKDQEVTEKTKKREAPEVREDKKEDIPPQAAKKLRGEASTFARRVEPKTEAGKLKWHALKDAFCQIIKPKISTYSVAEATPKFHLKPAFHLSQYYCTQKAYIKFTQLSILN